MISKGIFDPISKLVNLGSNSPIVKCRRIIWIPYWLTKKRAIHKLCWQEMGWVKCQHYFISLYSNLTKAGRGYKYCQRCSWMLLCDTIETPNLFDSWQNVKNDLKQWNFFISEKNQNDYFKRLFKKSMKVILIVIFYKVRCAKCSQDFWLPDQTLRLSFL